MSEGKMGHAGDLERWDEPLVLTKDKQVIVEMRLVRRKIPHGQARRKRNNVDGAIEAVFARNQYVVLGHGLSNEAVDSNAGADGDAQLRSLEKRLLGSTLGDIENVAGLKAHIFRLKFQNFFKVHIHLVLLAVAVAPDNDGTVGFRGMVQTASEGKELEGGELPAIIGNHEAARPGNGAQRIHD